MAAGVGAWLVLSLGAAAVVFLSSSATTTVASHDAVLHPDLSSHVVLDTGPVLPDLRVPTGSRIGAHVQLGKTDADSTEQLLQRYAVIGAQPEGPAARVREVLRDLLVSAAVRGAALGAVPVLLWLLVGRERRRALLRSVPTWRGATAVGLVALVGLALWQPWRGPAEQLDAERPWQSLSDFLGPDVPVPAELAGVEVRGDVTTAQTRRLVTSAVDTYQKGLSFYRTAAEAAADLDLRQPEDGESVVLVVTDRHDNVGMDPVARAVGDRGGATAVFDLGDDTSTGNSWEAFSLDSLDAAFDDGPYADSRWAVTGNHDNGTFVGDYLSDHGWTVLDDGEPVDGPDGVRILGTPDPRASGLGNWRDESGLSFSEVEARVTDAICAADADGDRIATVLVHDANMADDALERGCTDLVLGGHTHVRSGPTAITGPDGQVGYRLTTGTTGGAAYAIAVGASIRRPADLSLITYRDGRPVGTQGVLLQTTGVFEVGEWTPLELQPPVE